MLRSVCALCWIVCDSVNRSNCSNLKAISLLEPPAPSCTNSVLLSPPRPVNTPLASVSKNCFVSIKDILLSPSPNSSRTRQQLRERQIAKLVFSSPNRVAVSSDFRVNSLPPVLPNTTPSAIASSLSSEPEVPIDLSPRSLRGEKYVVPSPSGINSSRVDDMPINLSSAKNGDNSVPMSDPESLKPSEHSSKSCSSNSELDLKIAKYASELVSYGSPHMPFSLHPPVNVLNETTVSFIRQLEVTESTFSLSVDNVLKKNDRTQKGPSSSVLKTGNGVYDLKCPVCLSAFQTSLQFMLHECQEKVNVENSSVTNLSLF
ncbi:hypothetical protein AVEN_243514-1 [Araneus ventricosus]|uniref:Uncharacterized protein n=1 Tax=Araneus ventricosus TaxID=182803 RepID=A0A4Y2Q8N6_ARAVE|nr:hypothetical protein AVEN_243514-1 [Araneus ventricosus]